MNIKEHRKLEHIGMTISGKITEKDMGILTYPIRNHNYLYKRGGVLLERHIHIFRKTRELYSLIYAVVT